MPAVKYFDFTFDNSFEGKCKDSSWNRTEGVERQLCDLLNESRHAPITYSQVSSLTGWANLMIRKWFAALLTAGVFTDADTPRTQRWRLSRDFPDDRASLVELIPPISSTIVSRKQLDNQATSKTQSSPQVETVTTVDDEEYSLPGTCIDEDDDFFSVFSR